MPTAAKPGLAGSSGPGQGTLACTPTFARLYAVLGYQLLCLCRRHRSWPHANAVWVHLVSDIHFDDQMPVEARQVLLWNKRVSVGPAVICFRLMEAIHQQWVLVSHHDADMLVSQHNPADSHPQSAAIIGRQVNIGWNA